VHIHFANKSGQQSKRTMHVEGTIRVKRAFLAQRNKEQLQAGLGLEHCGKPMHPINGVEFGCWECGVTMTCEVAETSAEQCDAPA
jgi:hypothetical protein